MRASVTNKRLTPRKPMADDDPRGRIVWHDLVTTDPAAAIAFYRKTIGWGTEVWAGGGEVPYTVLKTAATTIGGVVPMHPGMRGVSHWLTYICSPDTDATCREAESLGGKVLTPATDISGIGRFAVLQDVQGATFASCTPGPPERAQGHDGLAEVGEFSWHELATTDFLAGFKFYSALFGWEKTGQFDLGPAGIYCLFGRRGVALGGMHKVPTERGVLPSWLPYVRVDDVKIAADRTVAQGGAVVTPPVEVPGGDWIAVGKDPQGGTFAVHQLKT